MQGPTTYEIYCTYITNVPSAVADLLYLNTQSNVLISLLNDSLWLRNSSRRLTLLKLQVLKSVLVSTCSNLSQLKYLSVPADLTLMHSSCVDLSQKWVPNRD